MPHQPFHNYPQRYSKSRAKASLFAQHLKSALQQQNRSLIATVVDTQFHLTAGYVTATTNLGVVPVYGVPYGTIVPTMRVYCHQQGGKATNRAYIFDAFAPNLSSLGSSSGSVVMTAAANTLGVAPVATSSTGMPTTASLTSSTGYYWHCFFYIPTLPSQKVTLWQIKQSGGSNILFLEYLPSGQIQFRSQDDHGYITLESVAPHIIHWIALQPGLSGNEFLVDGVSSYTGIQSPSDVPAFTAAGASYGGSFLGNADGTATMPIGSWISRMGYGASYAAGVVALTNAIPTDDTQITNLASGSTLETFNLYLFADTPLTSGLSNSALGGGSAATVNTSLATFVATGPY